MFRSSEVKSDSLTDSLIDPVMIIITFIENSVAYASYESLVSKKLETLCMVGLTPSYSYRLLCNQTKPYQKGIRLLPVGCRLAVSTSPPLDFAVGARETQTSLL